MTIDKHFISAESLLRDSFQLGVDVLRSGFRPTFIVGVWRGGAPVGVAVQEALEFHGLATDHIAIRASSYFGVDRKAALVKTYALDYLVDEVNAEDALLIVDDVFDSGRSIEAILAELKRRMRSNFPAEVRVATVYYKPTRVETDRVPDYFIHESDTWLVFPHEIQGLTREEILANKPVGADFFDPENSNSSS